MSDTPNEFEDTSDESFDEFKENFRDFNEGKGLVEPKDELEETWALTPHGIAFVIELYERARAGEPVEQIEEAMGLDPSDDHCEYKVLFAMGDITGLFDRYEEIVDLSKRLDQIEADYLYGEDK